MSTSHELEGICEGPELETAIAFCACGMTYEDRDEVAALEAHTNHHNQLKGNTMNKKMLINFSDDAPMLEVSAHTTEADRDWVHFYNEEGKLAASVLSRLIRHITVESPEPTP